MTQKLFKLKADAEFEAENIDDAFRILAEHFKNLSNGGDVDSDSELQMLGGSIEIYPLVNEEKTDPK